MHSLEVRARAREMFRAGVTMADTARTLGLPYHTVREWCRRHPVDDRQAGTAARCFRCHPSIADNPDELAYAYLLGLYLGDGHLVTSARVPVLRIACAEKWPGLIDECERAMLVVLATSVRRVPQPGCVSVQSYGRHWPCLLPQHGPGKKHERPIELAEWQQPIIDRHRGPFLRGLFHSDGARFANQVRTRGRTYVYPRYVFVNLSADIMRLCQESLDALGIAWRMNRPNSLSVARRDAVAALDRHVGPKR
ncbi:transcriptional regulator [Plantactinospora siamensis]|uniref:Transcriptional regulator n=1 Tax=Plantactinospora siamensis TaxID=555372 RepID=A0ABV6NZG5_9ACTN